MDKNTFASVEEYQMLEYVMRSLGIEVNDRPPIGQIDGYHARRLRRFLNTFNGAVCQLDDMSKMNSVLRGNAVFDISTGFVSAVRFDIPLFATMLRERYEKKIDDELEGRFPDKVVCSVRGYVRRRISDVAGLKK